jgi:hypothetical protein
MKDLPLSKVYQLLEPSPVVLLTTAHKGRANVMTMSWHMRTPKFRFSDVQTPSRKQAVHSILHLEEASSLPRPTNTSAANLLSGAFLPAALALIISGRFAGSYPLQSI